MPVNKSTEIPVNVVGSSTFGRYPKISLEKTYNMFISDDWLVNYAGFQNVLNILPNGKGRALFRSVRGNFILAIISSSVYKISPSLSVQFIGNIETVSGFVSIDENLNQQIAIADGESLWIYNYNGNTLNKQVLTFLGNSISPNYVCYHNTFFLITPTPSSINPQNWYAYEYSSPTSISLNTQFSLQTKPDTALAVRPLPGRGNNIIVFGSIVSEIWTQVGGLENYRRVQSFNIDNGCASIPTISANDQNVCWLAINENNSPTLLWTDGASVHSITSDGIDYLLQSIKRPDQSTAFFFREDGHVFYQITFFNKSDNVSLVYDFNTNKIFHVADENLNYHPARQCVFFNKKTYFIPINSGSLFQMSTNFVTYNYSTDTKTEGEEIPRRRICKAIRKADSSIFRMGFFTFWIEQGTYLIQPPTIDKPCARVVITEDGNSAIIDEQEDSNGERPIITEGNKDCSSLMPDKLPKVDLSFSKNGNASFSNRVPKYLNNLGLYKNQIRWPPMGVCNEITFQLEFWGFQRFVVYNGVAEIY